jgi:hypothetical protein
MKILYPEKVAKVTHLDSYPCVPFLLMGSSLQDVIVVRYMGVVAFIIHIVNLSNRHKSRSTSPQRKREPL